MWFSGRFQVLAWRHVWVQWSVGDLFVQAHHWRFNMGLGYSRWWHYFGAMVEHLEKGLWILQISKQGVPMAACSSHSGIEHLMQASRSYSVGAQRKVNSEGLKSSWWTKKEYGRVRSDICNFLNMYVFFFWGFSIWVLNHMAPLVFRAIATETIWCCLIRLACCSTKKCQLSPRLWRFQDRGILPPKMTLNNLRSSSSPSGHTYLNWLSCVVTQVLPSTKIKVLDEC